MRQAPRLPVALMLLPGLVFGSLSSASAQEQVARWQIQRQSVLGSAGGAEPYLFSRIAAVHPASGRRLVVVDSRQSAIRVFDGNGDFLHSIGGVGQGPGEYERITATGLVGDTLWLVDSRLRRTSHYLLNGALIKSTAWATEPVSADGRNHLNGLFADGMGWGESDGHVARRMRGGPEENRAVVRMSQAAETLDTIALVGSAHSMWSVPTSGRGFLFGIQRFSDAPLVVGATAADRLFVVERAPAQRARSARFRVVAMRSGGDTLWQRDYSYTPRRLGRAARDSYVTSATSGAEKSGASRERVREQLFLPDFLPPVSSAFTASDGALWLRREEGLSDVEYWVLTRDGAHDAIVTVPASLTLLAASDEAVWGTELDDDDVPRVVRYQIRR